MIIQQRNIPLELKLLRFIKARMDFDSKAESNYQILEKGYRGEREFDNLMVDFSENLLVLNDLLLEYNGTLFQIDSLMISSNSIYLFEVKNFEGDYLIENDTWYSPSKSEIKNPLLQLQRTESLIRRLLKELRCHIPIETYLFFVNPEFQLYQTPQNAPIVFPSQHKRFIKKNTSKQVTLKDSHSKLAQQLLSLNIIESPYSRLPEFDFDTLDKGISCTSCQSLDTFLVKTKLICKHCGCKEDYSSAVLRSVDEFKLLFPNLKLTTNQIHEWCNTSKAKKTIRKILANNFKKRGRSVSSYYEDLDS
ncbi:nuclease-related domain-containing protein [Bacillus sp. PS06]|uniref:nuclease-related domain-containing protein n=1 Tax=Bacillus sp. PS06 TaxID=2764176 RepID=UPI00178764A4|nr:nuclease-related domain-containing protein [Bacillus sp. PS06]MBD8069095.1 NERD domain-containing protein [Bacillus sp. PS06]